mgnify:CR=1 FL=1
MNYYEEKKRAGLIFTAHNINEKNPYIAMDPNSLSPKPIVCDDLPPFWSHLSGRYRTHDEQVDFMKGGCVDKKLPPITL